MTTADITRIKGQITTVLQTHAGVSPSRTQSLLPNRSLQGKLYEAHVLATICENLSVQERLQITFVGSNILTLRQKGGVINKSYPYFEVSDNGRVIGELFTDVYFTTLSYERRGMPNSKTHGDYHELDIALVNPGQTGYPHRTEISLAVECKNTSIKKSIIRELLGFRRELSFLSHQRGTIFSIFPTGMVASDPASVHMLYCSDNRISRYANNCLQFGILLQHHRM